MVGVKLAILGLVVAVGCTKTNAAAFCADGTCSDPNFAYCDVDGAASGEPGMCIAVTCTPGVVKQCHDGAAMTCNAGGNGYEDVACDLGCADARTAHCKYLQPKYLPDICDSSATAGPLVLTSMGTIDPNLDNTCTGGVVQQTGAPSICVIRNTTISITADARIVVAGLATMTGRSIAFVADGDLDIAGTLDLSAHVSLNGPGGGAIASQTAGSINGSVVGAMGGAGGATTGGAGATGTIQSGGSDGGALNGGPALMNPALLAAFYGGASTIRGTGETSDTFFAGGGGAAILVSCRGSISVSGVVNAGGGGGAGGAVALFPFPATGGGAGGNIVIQANRISVVGKIFANGGSGGSGWHNDRSQGARGQDGLASVSPALTPGAVDGAGKGGDGGYANAGPSDGRHPTQDGAGPGGGGGSVGFLQTYTPNGVAPTLTPAEVSPPFQPNGVVELR